jgi:Leucine rich repeat variant
MIHPVTWRTATATQLYGLATSRTAQVRALASSHRDLPNDLRERLTWDPDPGVAKNLADHPTLDADDLRLLAARHGPRLYSAIARNPHCPPELLHTMARNSHTVPKALREIARHPATEPRTLLVCLSDPEARRTAARHPALPTDALTALLDDPDQHTRAAAAENPSLPVETMQAMINQAGR